MQLTARNATLGDLAELLKEQHARKLDIVAPASSIRSENGVLVIDGSEPMLDADGVTSADGRYRPTDVCDEGVADKLKIPLAYVRRMRVERPDLYDANVNGWLHGNLSDAMRHPDERSFLVRCFRNDSREHDIALSPGRADCSCGWHAQAARDETVGHYAAEHRANASSVGIARAFLSDRFGIIDNLDVVTAALDGVRQSGAAVDVVGCDLSERRMSIRLVAPEIQALAPTLLAGYRSPYDRGHGGSDVVCGGLRIGNSETGGGAFSLAPWLQVLVCSNGMTVTKDVFRSTHLGSRMDDGVIRWSDEARAKSLELVTLRARDAVKTFLDVDYVRSVVGRIEEKAGAPISNPADTVSTIGKKLSFTEEQTNGVLEHFIRGGQMTAAGVLNAVTSWAQTVTDPDEASTLEAAALTAFEMAAA